MEFDKDKKYVQQVVRDKGKGKYIEENRSNTFRERRNFWKRQASRKKERYIEPRERVQKRREDFTAKQSSLCNKQLYTNEGHSEELVNEEIWVKFNKLERLIKGLVRPNYS